MASLAQEMWDTCARFLAHIPERDRDRLEQEAAGHINESYPSTLALLVGDSAMWTGYLAHQCEDNSFHRISSSAVAFLGDNTWLHHEKRPDGRSRLRLILPCPCGTGYQVHVVAAPRSMTERAATEDDLALLLDRLGRQTGPHAGGNCASVQRRDPFRDVAF